jgi:hypothetical protein
MDQSPTRRPIFRPMAMPSPRERLRVAPTTTSADFMSQVIFGREERPVPDPHATVEQAVIAYDRGARIAVRRMPAGYRKTIVT